MTRARFTYISKRQSDFAIMRGFNFHTKKNLVKISALHLYYTYTIWFHMHEHSSGSKREVEKKKTEGEVKGFHISHVPWQLLMHRKKIFDR